MHLNRSLKSHPPQLIADLSQRNFDRIHGRVTCLTEVAFRSERLSTRKLLPMLLNGDLDGRNLPMEDLFQGFCSVTPAISAALP